MVHKKNAPYVVRAIPRPSLLGVLKCPSSFLFFTLCHFFVLILVIPGGKVPLSKTGNGGASSNASFLPNSRFSYSYVPFSYIQLVSHGGFFLSPALLSDRI